MLGFSQKCERARSQKLGVSDAGYGACSAVPARFSRSAACNNARSDIGRSKARLLSAMHAGAGAVQPQIPIVVTLRPIGGS